MPRDLTHFPNERKATSLIPLCKRESRRYIEISNLIFFSNTLRYYQRIMQRAEKRRERQKVDSVFPRIDNRPLSNKGSINVTNRVTERSLPHSHQALVFF